MAEERDEVQDLMDRLVSVQNAIGGLAVGDTWATTLNLEDEEVAGNLARQLCIGVVAAVEQMALQRGDPTLNVNLGLAGAALRLGIEAGRAVESLMSPDIAKVGVDLTPDQLIHEARAIWNHGPSGSNARSVAFLMGMDVDDAMAACTELVDELKKGPRNEWPESALHRGICVGIAVERRRWQA